MLGWEARGLTTLPRVLADAVDADVLCVDDVADDGGIDEDVFGQYLSLTSSGTLASHL